MKKLIMILLLSCTSSIFAKDWSEYEALCYINDKEPNYEEYEYLSTEGATDYSYDSVDLENFMKKLEEGEHESK